MGGGGGVKILSLLVSKHCENLTSRLHNSIRYQPIFTDEVSKSKLRFSLPNKESFTGYLTYQVIFAGTLTGVQDDIRCEVLVALPKVNNLSWNWPDRSL